MKGAFPAIVSYATVIYENNCFGMFVRHWQYQGANL